MALLKVRINKQHVEGRDDKIVSTHTVKRVSFFGIKMKDIELQEDIELYEGPSVKKAAGFQINK